MSKAPEHFRPFNIEQAKAGAPYGLVGGDPVTILKWDARYPDRPLLGVYGEKDQAIGWNKNGHAGSFGRDLYLVMLPLGMCEGKPVFVGDKLEQRDRHNESWVALDAQIGHKDFSYSRWLSPYPKTRVAKHELAEFFSTTKPYADDCVDLANYAIECAIKSGDVVPDSLLRKVAIAVMAETMNANTKPDEAEYLFIDLDAIIKRVKEGV